MAKKPPRKSKADPEREDLAITPIYRQDHPDLGLAGVREIYRQGDRGFVADFDLRGFPHPYCKLRPVIFTGIEITSHTQSGPEEVVLDINALQTKLKKEFA